MKIGFVLDDSLDKSDGVQQYVLTLGQWFVKNGHEVHYLVGETHRQDIANIHSLSRNMGVRFNGNQLSVPLFASRRKIKNVLAAEKFDILHVQMPYSPWLAGQILRLAPPDVAVVGTFHIIPYSYFHTVASRILAALLRRSLLRFDYVLSVSHAARRFARTSFGLHTYVLPNAINVQKFRHPTSLKAYNDGIINLVFLGRLVPRKGCMELLKALTLLPELQSVRWRLLIGGTGPLRPQLERYVKKHNLDGVVRFCGFVPEKRKADFLHTAHIAIFPSRGGESFGVVLVEAMAAGAGVVLGGNNIGYVSVLGAWKSCLINPRDSVSLASRIHSFMTQKQLHSKLHTLQQAAVGQYDVGIIGPKLLKFYSHAIAKRR